jgi:hypothetical protein
MENKQSQQVSQSIKERQAALDYASDEDLAKIRRKQQQSAGVPIDQEWAIISEFAVRFGWDAYKEFRNDELQLDEMMVLIQGARKLEAKHTFDTAQAVFIGTLSAKQKNPSKTFDKMTKQLIKSMKVKD